MSRRPSGFWVALAIDILKRIEPLAEREGMLGNLLQDWADMGLGHPELGDEGLAVIHRLAAFYRERDPKQATYARMDAADYFEILGRWEEGRREYENLLQNARFSFYTYPLCELSCKTGQYCGSSSPLPTCAGASGDSQQ